MQNARDKYNRTTHMTSFRNDKIKGKITYETIPNIFKGTAFNSHKFGNKQTISNQ